MIDEATLKHIHCLIDDNKFSIELHAEMDILKQGYNWSKDFLKECLKHGKLYSGSELYPDKKERHKRYYCIHEYSRFLQSKLILIAFFVLDEIIIIHIQPLNKHSKEGKIYFNL